MAGYIYGLHPSYVFGSKVDVFSFAVDTLRTTTPFRILLSACFPRCISSTSNLEALATAISRVYTLSPCFRAEPSLTSRHLAEFWMLEAEWAFPGSNGVYDVCDFTESLLRDSLNNVVQSEIVDSLWKTCDANKRIN